MSQPLLHPKILLSVSLPPIPKTLSVSLSYFPLYISFYMHHSIPNQDTPKLGTSHLGFFILILSSLKFFLVQFALVHSISKSITKFYKKRNQNNKKLSILLFHGLISCFILFVLFLLLVII